MTTGQRPHGTRGGRGKPRGARACRASSDELGELLPPTADRTGAGWRHQTGRRRPAAPNARRGLRPLEAGGGLGLGRRRELCRVTLALAGARLGGSGRGPPGVGGGCPGEQSLARR